MAAQSKKQLFTIGGKVLWFLLSSGGILTTVWMFLSPHVDTYLEEKMNEFHVDDDVIHVGIIVRDKKEWYFGPDGEEHSVIYGEDGVRWWYQDGEMKQIYK